MHNPQHPQLLRALHTITQLADHIDEQLPPTQGNCQDAYKPPRTPGPTPPCNLTWLDFKTNLESTLQVVCAQLRADTTGLYGKPVPTITGMAGWLHHQHPHLEAATWIDSETWWHHTTGQHHTTATRELIGHATMLADCFQPPMREKLAGTALELSLETGVPVETIRTWGKRGRIPRFKGARGEWVYRASDIKNHTTRLDN